MVFSSVSSRAVIVRSTAGNSALYPDLGYRLFLEKGAHMFEEPPIYYILISLIFLIVFGAVAFAIWLVWLTPISFMAKLVMTAIGFLLCAITVILYTISAE